jgi:hypothetical protein
MPTMHEVVSRHRSPDRHHRHAVLDIREGGSPAIGLTAADSTGHPLHCASSSRASHQPSDHDVKTLRFADRRPHANPTTLPGKSDCRNRHHHGRHADSVSPHLPNAGSPETPVSLVDTPFAGRSRGTGPMVSTTARGDHRSSPDRSSPHPPTPQLGGILNEYHHAA